MASIPLSTPKPKGITPPQDVVLVARRQPPPPPGFSPDPVNVILPGIESAYLPRAPSLFNLSTLELLEMTTCRPEMTVSHTPAMGKIHYRLEASKLG